MKIFLSYRRAETHHVVSRLAPRLEEAFGPRSVFYDEESVGTGGDFLGQVGGAIHMSDVILVVIGRNWATITDARGRPRLSDRDDPVRWEVGLALGSGRILIPLLVDGAGMPARGDLPRELQDLATRSGFRLEAGDGFDASVDELIRRLGGPTARDITPPAPTRAPRRTSAWTSFEGHWQTQDGGMTQITQDGNTVELHGSGVNGAAFEGRGAIEGRSAVLEFRNSFGVRGRLALELVQNGAYINGRLQTPAGVTPFMMMRRT